MKSSLLLPAKFVSSQMPTSPVTRGLLASGSLLSVSAFYHLEKQALICVIPDNQPRMQVLFKAAMQKLSILGHDLTQLIDCSDVIPVPPTTAVRGSHLPAGNTLDDIEQAVSTVFSNRTGDSLT